MQIIKSPHNISFSEIHPVLCILQLVRIHMVYDWLNKDLTSRAIDLLTSNYTQLYLGLQKDPIHQPLKHGTQKQSTSLNQHRLWNLFILEL